MREIWDRDHECLMLKTVILAMLISYYLAVSGKVISIWTSIKPYAHKP